MNDAHTRLMSARRQALAATRKVHHAVAARAAAVKKFNMVVAACRAEATR